MVYIVLEMADVEILGVRVFSSLQKAYQTFRAICEEQSLIPNTEDLAHELEDTLEFAGDCAASVQLIEREVE